MRTIVLEGGKMNEGLKELEAHIAGAEAQSAPTSQPPEETLRLLKDGSYFNQHPGKVGGVAYETTNAHNRPVTEYRGTLEDLLNLITVEAPQLPSVERDHLQTGSTESMEELLSDEAAMQNILNVLRAHRIQKTRKPKNYQREPGDDLELQHFDTILNQYNDQLTEDEIKAWIWYKRTNDQYNDVSVIEDKSNGWSKYVLPERVGKAHLDKWMRDGIMCYMEGDYIPSVLYYSENIYERLEKLQEEAEDIKSRFGEEQYERQREGLEAKKPELLTLTDPEKENRLSIKPMSEFAEEFKIGSLVDGTVFTKKYKGFPSVKVDLSLKDAFLVWLEEVPKTEFKLSNPLDIRELYINNRSLTRYTEEERHRKKQKAKEEGDALFSEFLAESVRPKDQQRIEALWNKRFNGYVSVNYFKIPVAFTCSATFKNKPLFIRPAQREGIGFLTMQGSGCIAYDVGVGKTMAGILAIAQALESGMCKRPLIVVPNSTYKNWLSEIRGKLDKKGNVLLTGMLPQYPVNEFYNLNKDVLESLQNEEGEIESVPEQSITVITLDGMKRLGFNETTWESMGAELYGILNQGEDGGRAKSALMQRIKTLMGRAEEGAMADIENFGFDYILVDEGHKLKNIFSKVSGEITERKNKLVRENTKYEITASTPSAVGLKGFMISQYILSQNKNRNVVLLTATPFTNSPLEIYSMLALIGFHRLVDSNIHSLQGFFNTFIKTEIMLTINAKMRPERKEVVMGFQNLIALQRLIYQFIDYKSGEDANIQRPEKVVYPKMQHMVNGQLVPLPPEEQVSTNLPMTLRQQELMDQIQDYVVGNISFDDFCLNPAGLEDQSDEKASGGNVLQESGMSQRELEGARVLRGISLARQIALSPYLFSCSPVSPDKLDYKEYIETSPKLLYTMLCIRSVKEYHESRGEPMSGQIVYMNAGVDYFQLIKEYLVKELGFDSSEVETIRGGMSPDQKERVKDKFQDGRVHVLLGTEAILEGINLQYRTSVLYNLWLDWNPTALKQLEGRAWRFPNIFAYVRIVIPLIENSIDVAIFQKEEEKTSRINEVWQQAGKSNTLNLAEFNPAELKMGLITDPELVAEISLMEKSERLEDDIAGLRNQITELNDIIETREEFDEHYPEIEKRAEEYRPRKEDQQPRAIGTILGIFQDYLEDENESPTHFEKQHYRTVRRAHSALSKALERILEPRGLDLDFNEKVVIGRIEDEIAELEAQIEAESGDEAKAKLVKEIIAKREASGYKSATVQERVQEFARHNEEMLSKKMVYRELAPAKDQEPTPDGSDNPISENDNLARMRQLVADMEEMENVLMELSKLRKAA